MFTHIRHRLLLSYLAVLTAVLTTFAIAVRFTFSYSLNQQLITRLETLARAASLELELEEEELVVDQETLINSSQGIQWFDTEGTLLAEEGEYEFKIPFNPEQRIQTQRTPHPAISLIIPVHDYDTDEFVGYTRVNESTVVLNRTLRSLDLGLVGGVLMALILSGVGSIWLTRQAMQPIENSFRRLQQFTSDASHELRSPLMAIRTNAAVALKYSEGMRELDAQKFEAIKSASVQMTALTEDLLLLARTDREKGQQWEAVNLNDLVKALLQLYQLPAQAKQIHLQAQLTEPLWVMGDKVQLTRLLTNLIDNALKYTPERGTVEILATLEKEHFQILIKDTGIGIAPEHLEHIFDRFWQIDRARSHHTRGFGLGLAIAQNIARNHRGLIRVTSQMGVGSCFTVELPCYC